MELDSPAYRFGLRASDRILEINSRDIKNLTAEQIFAMMETRKWRRRLQLLVINLSGYEFAQKHAMPLNSLFMFVQSDFQEKLNSKTSNSLMCISKGDLVTQQVKKRYFSKDDQNTHTYII